MNVGVRLVTVGKKGNLYFKRRADKYNIAGLPSATQAGLNQGIMATSPVLGTIFGILNLGLES